MKTKLKKIKRELISINLLMLIMLSLIIPFSKVFLNTDWEPALTDEGSYYTHRQILVLIGFLLSFITILTFVTVLETTISTFKRIYKINKFKL